MSVEIYFYDQGCAVKNENDSLQKLELQREE
jgi:hypothetical protein